MQHMLHCSLSWTSSLRILTKTPALPQQIYKPAACGLSATAELLVISHASIINTGVHLHTWKLQRKTSKDIGFFIFLLSAFRQLRTAARNGLLSPSCSAFTLWLNPTWNRSCYLKLTSYWLNLHLQWIVLINELIIIQFVQHHSVPVHKDVTSAVNPLWTH